MRLEDARSTCTDKASSLAAFGATSSWSNANNELWAFRGYWDKADKAYIWSSIHQYPRFSFPIAANMFMIHQTLRLELRIAAIYKGLARFSSGVDSCLCSRRCRQIAISPVLTLRYLSEGWNPVSIQHDMCICSGPRRTMQNKHQIVADRDPTIIGRESVSSCYFLLDRYPLWID